MSAEAAGEVFTCRSRFSAHLPDGDYALSVHGPGLGPVVRRFTISGVAPVDLGEIALPAPGSVSGALLDEPQRRCQPWRFARGEIYFPAYYAAIGAADTSKVFRTF